MESLLRTFYPAAYAGPFVEECSMAGALNPAQYFLPVADRDCVVELLLPPPAAEQEEEDERPTKQARLAVEATADRVVTCEAASQLLKAASPKFRC